MQGIQISIVSVIMREWTEEEYEKEAEKLGWTVEYLKSHLQKDFMLRKFAQIEEGTRKEIDFRNIDKI